MFAVFIRDDSRNSRATESFRLKNRIKSGGPCILHFLPSGLYCTLRVMDSPTVKLRASALLLLWVASAMLAAAAASAAPKRIALWNGHDLTGWKIYIGTAGVDAGTVWSARDGVLRFDTKASGYAKTDQNFSDYHLHVEWRWPKDAAPNSNSGVLVHLHGPDAIWPLCFECQLKTGNAGQVVGMGLDIPAAPLQNNRKRAPRLAAVSEKPLGEWNSYDITCRGATIEAFVNGVRQNFVGDLPAASGSIALQMEGYPIEFRNVWLESL
jgi:hypothetical protein